MLDTEAKPEGKVRTIVDRLDTLDGVMRTALLKSAAIMERLPVLRPEDTAVRADASAYADGTILDRIEKLLICANNIEYNLEAIEGIV